MMTKTRGTKRFAELLFSLCFITMTTIVCAQLPGDQFYSVQDDSEQQIGSVNYVMSDRIGLIWVGTETGLYNYDGYEFRQKKLFHDSLRRSEPAIWAMEYDSVKHTIWIGDQFGIRVFDIDSENTIEYRIKAKDESLTRFRFKDILHDHDGVHWVTSFNGLLECREADQSCELYQIEEDRDKVLHDPYWNRLNCVLPHDHPDSLWIGALKGMYSFHKSNKTFVPYISNFRPQSHGQIVTSIGNTPDYLVLGFYAEGVILVDKSTKNVDRFEIPQELLASRQIHPVIREVEKKNENEFWVCTSSGLFSFDFVQKKYEKYHQASQLIFDIQYPNCFDISRDRFGHWWAAFENGLSQWDPTRSVVKAHHINDIFDDEQAWILVDVNESPDNKIMAVGHRKGLFIWDEEDFQSVDFAKYLPVPPGEEFYDMLVLNSRKWLISDDRRLFLFDPQTLDSRQILNESQYIQSDMHLQLSHVYDSVQNKLWIGRQWGRGIGVIDIESGESKLYPQSFFIADSLITTTGFGNIGIDDNGHIWFTTGIGICRFNPDSESISHYRIPAESRNANIYAAAVGMTKDSEQNLWFSFLEHGIYRYNQSTDSLVHIGFDLEHEVREFGEILFDQSQHLWIMTNVGAIRLQPSDGSAIQLTTQNGLPKNNLFGCFLNEIADRYITIQGQDWMGWIDRDQLGMDAQFLAQPSILSIHTGSKQNEGIVEESDQIKLHYGNTLDVQFAALNYKAQNLNRYRYRLDGLHSEWVDLGTHNSFQLGQIPPGNYTLKIETAHSQLNWSEPAILEIQVIPPWWRTIWAILGGVGILALAIWGFNRYRAQQIRREESIKSAYEVQLAELEMEALRSQMNPHFIFNALNSIKHFILSNDKFLAAEYLSNFSRLVRKILNNSKSPVISLEEELDTLRLYLDMEQLRFGTKFEYMIDVEEDIDLDAIQIPPLIFQPYVENAIWHGLMHKEETGRLSISVKKDNQHIVCIIEDNGIGRAKANEINTKSTLKKKSFGMQITKARINMSRINATSKVHDLVDADGQPLGTQVMIHFPHP